MTTRIRDDELMVAPTWGEAWGNLISEFDVPHLEEYFGVWCVEEGRFRALADHASTINFAAHIKSVPEHSIAAKSGAEITIISGGIAVIDIDGPMQKHVSSFSGGTSTIRVRRQLRLAANDQDVLGIVVRVDSPGGTVSGTSDLAADIAMAASIKPVHVFVEDMAASAAMWVASQATKIFANATALVGSIGTFMVVSDLSGAAEQEGIKVHVIRAGEFKGAGVAGTAITDDQRAEWQRIVDALNAHFIAGVAKGRRMSVNQVTEIADGRIHLAAQALKLGLIDGVQTFDETIRGLRKQTEGRSAAKSLSKGTAMDGVTDGATIQELKKAMPDAHADFLVSCVEKELPLADAKDAWMGELRSKVQASESRAESAGKRADELEQEKEAAAKVPANSAIGTSPGGSGDVPQEAAGQIEEMVSQEMSTKGIARHEAYRNVCKANPELREKMVQQHNAAHGRSVRD